MTNGPDAPLWLEMNMAFFEKWPFLLMMTGFFLKHLTSFLTIKKIGLCRAGLNRFCRIVPPVLRLSIIISQKRAAV